MPFSAHIALVLLATLPAGLLLAATSALLVVSRGGRLPILGIMHRPLTWALITFALALIGVGLVANLAFEIASCATIGTQRPSPSLEPDKAVPSAVESLLPHFRQVLLITASHVGSAAPVQLTQGGEGKECCLHDGSAGKDRGDWDDQDSDPQNGHR